MTIGYFNTVVVRNLLEFSHLWEAENNTHKSNHITQKNYVIRKFTYIYKVAIIFLFAGKIYKM